MTDLISFEEFKEFWESEPIVVIDSSSLLDLYRYAPSASKKVLENLKSLQELIWLPAQVKEEYLENKALVIKQAHKKFENVSKEVLKIVKKAEQEITSKFYRYGKFKYPKINTFRNELGEAIYLLNEKARSFTGIVTTEIQENKAVLLEDEVDSFIQMLTELNRIGDSFSLPKKLEIYREGEFRYSYLIPPGYEDSDKDSNDPTKTKKFGDLMVWKQLLDKSKEVRKAFIFITDDEKGDWWNLKKENGHLGERVELLSPRKELVSEFETVSQIGHGGFLMLTLPEFNKHISKINEVNLKEVYLDEVELNPEEVVREIVEFKEWQLILDESGELTHSFIHDGELQDLTGEILMNVEIAEFLNPEFDNLYVDYDADEVIIEGSFSSEVIVDIETALSREHNERNEAKLLLTGNLTVEFNFEYDEDNEVIERTDETVTISGIIIENFDITTETDYSDISCVSCRVRPGLYSTNEGDPVCGNCLKNFDTCTKCGRLFEFGVLGGYYCDNCRDD